jgi:Domain of unknown function (DUF4384)
MFATLGWVLLAGLPPSSPTTHDVADPAPTRPHVVAGRVAVWADRDDPYDRGDGARVYLTAQQPTHVVVFRVDTDGRIQVLYPREPWGDTWIRDSRRLELPGGSKGRTFVVDDDPGIGYLFAIASRRPFNFDEIARGDHWDYRAIEGGRITGDPYVALTSLAARITPGDQYDYDVTPYYVERRYDYPRFVCYDCHAYAKYDDWDPYRRACARFRVVIYDDPRYYPYRAGRGTNVVIEHAHRPEPRFVFRDADPDREYVTRVTTGGSGEYRYRQAAGRTSRDVGGRGAVPVPGLSSDRATPRTAPSLRAVPSPPAAAREKDTKDTRRRRIQSDTPSKPPTVKPSERERPREPQSTGEPELRRRKP